MALSPERGERYIWLASVTSGSLTMFSVVPASMVATLSMMLLPGLGATSELAEVVAVLSAAMIG